jgi:hypothetical protein
VRKQLLLTVTTQLIDKEKMIASRSLLKSRTMSTTTRLSTKKVATAGGKRIATVPTSTASNTRSVLVGYDTTMLRFNSNNTSGTTMVCRRTFFSGRQKNTGYNRQNTHHGDNHHRNRFFFSSAAGRDPGLEITSVISDPKEVEAPRGLPSRAEQVRRLQSPTIRQDGAFDILVIGGGATGAGVALDAAQRGLQTACIERGDFASETSSRSTKLIWVSTIIIFDVFQKSCV